MIKPYIYASKRIYKDNILPRHEGTDARKGRKVKGKVINVVFLKRYLFLQTPERT
jgi:hypothetical protein